VFRARCLQDVTVVPDTTFGAPLSVEHQGYPSTSGMVVDFFNGDNKAILDILVDVVKPQYMVSIRDIARLHVIAALHPDVSGERLFGHAKPYNWNRVLQFYRKKFPQRTFVDDFPGLGRDLAVIEGRERSVELLREMTGNEDGFESFDEAVWDNVKAFA
jgi:nucleoside-diphosphate-sugar epimerase